MKLKLGPFCSPLDGLLHGIIFLSKSKFSFFWPKTMDYDYFNTQITHAAIDIKTDSPQRDDCCGNS